MSPPTDGIRASSSAPLRYVRRRAHPRVSLSSSATLAAVQADAVSRIRCCARHRSRNVCIAGKKAPKMSVNVRSQPGCGYVPAYGVPVGAATRLGTADALARGSSAGVGGTRPISDACSQSPTRQPRGETHGCESRGFGHSQRAPLSGANVGTKETQCRWNLTARPQAKRSKAEQNICAVSPNDRPFGASVSTKSNLLGSSGPAAVAYIRRLAPPRSATARSRSHRTARCRLSAAQGTAVQAVAHAPSRAAGVSRRFVQRHFGLAPIFLACNMARLKAAWQQHSTDALLRLSPPTAHFAVKLSVAHLFSG